MKLDEIINRCVIRPRWKGHSEFMSWGSFSYHHKGTSIPCLRIASPACSLACQRYPLLAHGITRLRAASKQSDRPLICGRQSRPNTPDELIS